MKNEPVADISIPHFRCHFHWSFPRRSPPRTIPVPIKYCLTRVSGAERPGKPVPVPSLSHHTSGKGPPDAPFSAFCRKNRLFYRHFAEKQRSWKNDTSVKNTPLKETNRRCYNYNTNWGEAPKNVIGRNTAWQTPDGSIGANGWTGPSVSCWRQHWCCSFRQAA